MVIVTVSISTQHEHDQGSADPHTEAFLQHPQGLGDLRITR
jgi:hypothetical protein